MVSKEQLKRPKQMENLTREYHLGQIRALEEEERTVELSFSSEEPYSRWFGAEILDHSEGCVDLKRLKDVGCVLFNHGRDKVVAGIVDAWRGEGRCKAKVRFDKDEESDAIYQKVLSGTLKGVSVGYRVDTWEEVPAGKWSKDGRFAGPCSIAKSWWPFEISIVSVPADPTVGVGRSMEKGRTLDWYARQLQTNKNKFRRRMEA